MWYHHKLGIILNLVCLCYHQECTQLLCLIEGFRLCHWICFLLSFAKSNQCDWSWLRIRTNWLIYAVSCRVSTTAHSAEKSTILPEKLPGQNLIVKFYSDLGNTYKNNMPLFCSIAMPFCLFQDTNLQILIESCVCSFNYV